MSNNIKVFALITLAFAMMVGSLVTLNYLIAQPDEKNRKLAGSNLLDTRSKTSVAKSSINTFTNQSQTQLILVNNIVNSRSTSAETSKQPSQPKTIVQNGVTIEFIDQSNQPLYIQDYLNCETKYLKNESGKITHYGNFYTDNGTIQYRCPPKMETQNCTKNIVYIDNAKIDQVQKINDYNPNPYQNGWNCDQFYAWTFVTKQMDPCYGNATEKNLQPENFVSDRLNDQKCVLFFEKGTKIDENLIAKILNRFKSQNPSFELQGTTVEIVEG
jgi:hypothetical protein